MAGQSAVIPSGPRAPRAAAGADKSHGFNRARSARSTSPHRARLAADITRLASTAPNDTARTFRGIPFSVRTAYRFTPVAGIEAVVADIVRSLNQEANPLEEHTLIVGERPAGSTTPFRLAYREVTAGSDETLESSDVLAAVTMGTPPHVDLVLAREGYESNAYALLERQPDGSWRLRWTSAHTGC